MVHVGVQHPSRGAPTTLKNSQNISEIIDLRFDMRQRFELPQNLIADAALVKRSSWQT
jgi:hypothetical protein